MLETYLALHALRAGVATIAGKAVLDALVAGLLGCRCAGGCSGALAPVVRRGRRWRLFGRVAFVYVTREQVTEVHGVDVITIGLGKETGARRCLPSCKLVTAVLAFVGSVARV